MQSGAQVCMRNKERDISLDTDRTPFNPYLLFHLPVELRNAVYSYLEDDSFAYRVTATGEVELLCHDLRAASQQVLADLAPRILRHPPTTVQIINLDFQPFTSWFDKFNDLLQPEIKTKDEKHAQRPITIELSCFKDDIESLSSFRHFLLKRHNDAGFRKLRLIYRRIDNMKTWTCSSCPDKACIKGRESQVIPRIRCMKAPLGYRAVRTAVNYYLLENHDYTDEAHHMWIDLNALLRAYDHDNHIRRNLNCGT